MMCLQKRLKPVVWKNSRYVRTTAGTLAVGLLTAIIANNVSPVQQGWIFAMGTFLGEVGNDLFLAVTNLVLLYWAWRRKLRSVIVMVLGMDLGVWIAVQGTKLMALGASWSLRPNGHNGGFPSGHATHAFAMAFVLTLFFPRWCWLWYGIASAISWSRVEVLWHSGFQVTVGIVLGTVIGGAAILFWSRHRDAEALEQEW